MSNIALFRRFNRDIPALIGDASYLPPCDAKARLERNGYAVRAMTNGRLIGDDATGDYRRFFEVSHELHDGQITVAHYPGCAVSPPSFAAWIF